ncbi:uncharacterized protein N7446_010769 [Penicillium canescens]|uniref:Uncharacterized protein n=1 Tax=Penicillium canescens TaxID=5083 RepID=A0AAD6N808_PENCN|nr:uncharacterized protein N7446_010769 [Penicillium canescens]KAJ6041342.1 hypothetical protein N7460_006732 [Penicillium canescens]KAJ6050660.1 hypothetical protein N7446_010769 [Penicillium canescens]
MDRQISSQNEPSPHTKRRHKPAIGKFSIPRGAYKMPPTAAFKPPAKSPGHLSAPMRNLPVRRQLTFDSEVDSEVPKVHNPGSLPSPVSDTTMSLPPSRSCSPDDSQSSMEDLPDGIKEALLTNPPLRNINSSLASKCVIM